MKKTYLFAMMTAVLLLPGCDLLAQLGLGSGSGLPKDEAVMEDSMMEDSPMEGQESMQMMDADFDPGDDPDKMEGEWSEEEMKAMEEKMMMENDSMEKDESAMMDSSTDSKYATGVLNDYSAEAFAQARADGKKILLDFHADWCPTCRSNDPLIRAALTDSDVIGFKVNYDTEIDLKKTFGVTTQSTLVLLNGEMEVTKIVGVQTADTLSVFLGR